MKKTICAALVLAAAAGLAACNDAAPAPAETAATAAAGDEAAALTISDAALILPAVKGNPGVAYFTLHNAGDRTLAVRTFAVEGAGRTEFHGSMEMDGKMTMAETGPQVVPAHGETKFEPGSLHVMLFDLDPKLVPGATTTMTVTVAGGASTRFDLPVKAAGDAR